MIFERAWVLPSCCCRSAWMFFEWRGTRRVTALVLKTLSFLAIVLALAEPTLTVPQTKMAVAVLVDTSSSVSPAGPGSRFRVRRLLSTKRAAATGFASYRLPDPFAIWLLLNKAACICSPPLAKRDAPPIWNPASTKPSARSRPAWCPRLVLVSDGKENAGSITRAAWQAQRLGIPIDTVPMQGRPQPTLRLESVTVPTVAFTGEQFPLDLSIASPTAVSGSVQISAEGKVLGSNPLKLEKGDNQVRVHASLTAAGALSLTGLIQTNGSAKSGSIAPSLCGVPRSSISRKIPRAPRRT